jgi:hypothetical protein
MAVQRLSAPEKERKHGQGSFEIRRKEEHQQEQRQQKQLDQELGEKEEISASASSGPASLP